MELKFKKLILVFGNIFGVSPLLSPKSFVTFVHIFRVLKSLVNLESSRRHTAKKVSVRSEFNLTLILLYLQVRECLKQKKKEGLF